LEDARPAKPKPDLVPLVVEPRVPKGDFSDPEWAANPDAANADDDVCGCSFGSSFSGLEADLKTDLDVSRLANGDAADVFPNPLVDSLCSSIVRVGYRNLNTCRG
jgi:hypothetical protein